MRKTTTLMMLFMLTCMGAMAQVVTTWSSSLPTVTKADFEASAGSGERYAFRMPSTSKPNWCGFNSSVDFASSLDEDHLFTLENSTTSGKYWLKRCSNGEYLSGQNAFGTEGIDLTLTDRGPEDVSDYDEGFDASSDYVSFDNDEGGHYNCGNGNYNFAPGTGGWSVYAVYGPIYIVNVTCIDNSTNETLRTVQLFALDGTEVTAPSIPAYTPTGNTSVTVNGADEDLTVYYQSTSVSNYDAIQLTFKRTGSTASDVTVLVADLDGNPINGVSATLTATSITEFKTGAAAALAREDNSVLAPQAGYGNQPNDAIDYTLMVSGLNTKFEYNTVGIDVYALNAGGSAQSNTQTIRKWAFDVSTGDNESSLTTFVAQDDNDICSVPDSDGGLYHKLWEMTAEDGITTTATNPLYLKITLTKTDEYGCFAGLGKVTLTTVDPRDGLKEAIEAATADYNALNDGASSAQVGYPSASALASLQAAIAAAQAVYDAKNGGYDQAIEDLAAALAEAKSTSNINYTPRTDVYYTITSGRGSMVYDENHSDSQDADGNEFLWYTNNLDNTDVNHLWGFIESDGKYYMYNVGKRQFANVTQSGSYQGSNGDAHTWMFSDAPSAVVLDAGEGDWVKAPNVRVRATSEVTGKQYAMSISTSYVGPVIAYDAVNDGGIPMTFAISEVPEDVSVTAAIEALLENLAPYAEALQLLLDKADDIVIGDKLNQYKDNGSFSAALEAAKAELAKVDSKETTKSDLTQAREALEKALAALELNMPQPNTFLRIFSVSQEGYVSSALDEAMESPYNTYFTDVADASDKGTIWFYDGTGLLNYATGLYATGVQAAEIGTESGEEFTFSEATNGTGMYWIKPATTNYWFGGNPTLDKWSTPASNENTRFTLEEVTELPITLTEVDGKYYATFSAPVDIETIDGAELYMVTVNGDKAEYEKSEMTGLPANTGVLLIGTSEEATATIGEYTGDVVETGLEPQAATVYDDDNLFFGVTNESAPAFLKTNSEVAGFSAFISSSDAGGEDVLELVDSSETDGIESIHNSLTIDKGDIYNLQGQKVTKAQKGVFIQNGKKVVVK